jgi:hypothetical protein
MYVAMAKLAKESAADSAETVVFQFFNLIKVAGFRLAEYAQTTLTKVDKFEYASGNKVINSLTAKCVPAGTKNSRSEDFLLAKHTSHKHPHHDVPFSRLAAWFP